MHAAHSHGNDSSYSASHPCHTSSFCCDCYLPLLGDADGPAHVAIAMTADPPLPGAADGPAHDATAMTDAGPYILMATKEDLREFGVDPTALPIVLVYKGEILVSNDNTPLYLGVSTVLQEFDDVFLGEVPAGLPPLHGIEHHID
jgi:hypothetical protein